MKQIKVMMLMVAACLAGCSSDDEPQNQQGEAPRLMIVDVSEKPVDDGKKSAPRTNRTAAYTTTATLSRFFMNYMGNEYDFKKTGESWSTNSWPAGVDNDQKLDFYAYTAGTFNYNGGNPYVAFTVEESVSSQHDLLVAEHKQISYDDAGGRVSLTFDHACAIVCFNVYLSETLSTQLGGSLQVNSIILRNVNNQGDYYYASKSWSNVSGTAYYTLTTGDITVTTDSQRLTCGYIFMIPQTRVKNGTEGTYLEIKYKRTKDETAKTATIPLNINWKAGELRTININLGTAVITL
jgi:hypothetical protein